MAGVPGTGSSGVPGTVYLIVASSGSSGSYGPGVPGRVYLIVGIDQNVSSARATDQAGVTAPTWHGKTAKVVAPG